MDKDSLNWKSTEAGCIKTFRFTVSANDGGNSEHLSLSAKSFRNEPLSGVLANRNGGENNGQNLPLKTRFLDFFQRHFSAVFLDTTSMDSRL
jgi:hypothetical protein